MYRKFKDNNVNSLFFILLYLNLDFKIIWNKVEEEVKYIAKNQDSKNN